MLIVQDPGSDQLASKQQYDFTNPFPFLLVNIGSGVNEYGEEFFRKPNRTLSEMASTFFKMLGEYVGSTWAWRLCQGVRNQSWWGNFPGPLLPPHTGSTKHSLF